MALEPYRPKNDPRYRDELDQELDQKIDNAFSRWNWKLARFVRRGIIVVFAIWLLWNIVPTAIEFVGSTALGPAILQFLGIVAYLFFFIGFQFFLMFYFMGRTRVYWLNPGETGIGFKDYKGNPEVLEAARRIVTLLRGAKEFKDMGGELTRGVLLIGPPGTGKSYMAQAVATEAGVPFGYLSAPSLTSAFMGMGNMKVMLLYRKARKLAREYGACILFIDEIDAIGMARSSNLMGSGAMANPADPLQSGKHNVMGMGMNMGAGSGLLNELLIQMDPPPHEQTLWGKMLRFFGLRSKKRVEMPPVLTMGATNLAETLDAALLRPGRFDRKIVVDLPDSEGRKEIIEYYLAKVKHEPMPMDRMVSDTITYSPVAIKFVINEAVIHAHFDNRQAINYWDFTKAREAHEYGLTQPIRNMAYEERRQLAYHEAGHAYAMVKLLKKERLTKVTIIRHGRALGFAAWKPQEERHIRSQEELLNSIKISLASRAAEELFLKEKFNGVVSDFQQATGMAMWMIGALGMEDTIFSHLVYGMGGMSSPDIQKRVEKILQAEYAKIKALVEANKEAVIAIAEALILRNELTDIDVAEILRYVEIEHPFTDPTQKVKTQRVFGFKPIRELPANTNGRRRVRNGHGNGSHMPETQPTPPIMTPPPAPAAHTGDELTS
jgi:ATP-dependent Zn protease